MKYTPVIGLEVHVEPKTKSKMFCSCSAEHFAVEPNTHTCPVCLGMPGALPVPNRKAVEWCVMIGLALNCDIPPFSKFDRKNYFYPDLPKGYQISQYDEPFCLNGTIQLSNGKTIRIRRVHMEEDTGKLLHEGDSSFIDFNRSGVPLVEIVTEPDFDNAKDVKEYLQKLQQIVRYLGVSEADMEKGMMRLEPNISLQAEGEIDLPKYKVEVKNINSFKFVEKAINFELERQQKILEEGKIPVQETRGWDEKKQITVSQRVKEEANDYRYFPEPDIPPIRWEKAELEQLAKNLPELPDIKVKRFMQEYNLSAYDVEILTREKVIADYFEQAVKDGKEFSITPKQIANKIINQKINIEEVLPSELVKQIVAASQTASIDENELETIVKKVLEENKKAVEDFKAGKQNALMFLMGQVMRQLREKVDPKIVTEKLQKMIK